MSKKDLQFIERALAHPWMFWVYFWKWPRIVRQACAEYDLLAKERDVAKEAHEQAVRANKIVRDWIHVTHRLDLTADMRAIWTAGKRLSALLLFLALTLSANAQLPPILRNQWTTNANPLALKVISTNGISVATNVWEVDFTNTSTVTVSAVSSANKVMVSFAGSASSGSSSLTNALLHAGPTNGSVGALVLTAGDGITLTTSGTNRVLAVSNNIITGSGFWTNADHADIEGGTVQGIRDVNPIASVAFLGANLLTNRFAEPSALIALGYLAGSETDGSNAVSLVSLGDRAGSGQSFQYEAINIYNLGGNAGESQFGTNVAAIYNFGSQAGASQILTNSNNNMNIGGKSGFQQVLQRTIDLHNIGTQSGRAQSTTNSRITFNIGYASALNQSLTITEDIFNLGRSAGNGQVLINASNIYSFGTEAGASRILDLSRVIYAIGEKAGNSARITNCDNILFLGAWSGTNLTLNAKTNIALFGNVGSISPANEEFWFGNTNNISRFPGNVVIRSATAPTVGQILTATDTSGTVGWSNAPAASGGGIASIFTNNVLAGGPGLTELEFTNTSSVTWTATTNAGRVTMSASAAAGAQTPWASDIDAAAFSLTNFGSHISFTNGSRVGATATNTLTLTNSHLAFAPYDSWDIGKDNTNGPRNIYLSGFLASQGNASGGGSVRAYQIGGVGYVAIQTTGAKSGLYRNSVSDHFCYYDIGDGRTVLEALFGTADVVVSSVGGNVLFTPSGGLVKFGGSTASFPALKRTAAGLELVGAGGVGASTNNLAIAGSLSITNSTTLANVTADRVAVFNSGKQLTNSAAVDTTELETLDGVTSAIQTQLDGKQVGSATLTNLAATKAFTNVTRTVITNVGVSLYTVPAGCKYIYVECIGGGGGGGGVDGAASQSAAGGGGGSGAYCTTNIVNPAASYIVTVGTNGLGGAAAAGVNNGTIGGTTLFTNILTALGGSGGSGDASAAAVGFAIGGAGALETATGYIYSGGSPGQHGICMSGTLAVSGGGAGSIFGGGGAPQTAAAGANATGKGAGGSGAAATTNVDRAGGNGSPGMIMIREYYQ